MKKYSKKDKQKEIDRNIFWLRRYFLNLEYWTRIRKHEFKRDADILNLNRNNENSLINNIEDDYRKIKEIQETL